MLTLLFPLLIVLSLIVGVLLLVRRQFFFGAFSIIFSLALNIYSESFPILFFSSEHKEGITLKVMTYNVGLNNEYLRHNKDSLSAMMTFFEQQNADIIILPESRLKSTNKRLFKRLSQLYPYNISTDYSGNDFYIETFVFSRYPISNAHQLENYYIYSMDVTLPNEILINLIACHLESNQNHSQLNGGKGLWSNLSSGYRSRAIQTELICDNCDYRDNKYLLICGDMNDISGSATLRTLQHRLHLKDAWWKGGCGYGATFTGKNLLLRLDHILYSRYFDVTDVTVTPLDFSDHLPLVAEFIVN